MLSCFAKLKQHYLSFEQNILEPFEEIEWNYWRTIISDEDYTIRSNQEKRLQHRIITFWRRDTVPYRNRSNTDIDLQYHHNQTREKKEIEQQQEEGTTTIWEYRYSTSITVLDFEIRIIIDEGRSKWQDLAESEIVLQRP